MGMANPDLTWQTTKKFNVGLNSSLFGDRVNINFDYYRETTDDMLIDVSLPPSSGANSVKNNFGKQRSNGIEFSLSGQDHPDTRLELEPLGQRPPLQDHHPEHL